MSEKIAVIGAGRLAWQLVQALRSAGQDIVNVWSRSYSTAYELAQLANAEPCAKLEEISSTVTLIIIAVTDTAIAEVAGNLHDNNCLIVHTSGSIPMAVLGQSATDCGVIYPVQTFSKDRPVNFKKIPLLIEGSSASTLARVETIAVSISEQVQQASSEQRKYLHLAAVFVNNFSNHMLTIGQNICSEQGLDFSLLQPLIQETTKKAMELGPRKAQTGPAVRYDEKVIETQQELLSHHELYQKIYTFVSKSIFEQHKKK